MKKALQFVIRQKTLVMLILLIAAASILSPFFLTKDNIINVLTQSAIYGIMACGMTFAIIGGDFDLSIGSTLALSGLIAIMMEPHIGQAASILLALVCAGAIGVFNGILVAYCGISSFIVTIGTSNIFKGVALRISDGKPIASANAWFSKIGSGNLFGIPYMVITMVVLVLITSYVLNRTRYGRNVYAIGGSMEVAHNSGVNTRFAKASIFVLSALSAGIAGVLNASRLNTASAIQGDSVSLSVITGVVIGGTSLIGGVGGIGKSIIGIFIFQIITNALDLMGIYTYYQTGIRGIILVVIMATEAYSRHRAEQKKR